MLNTRANGPTMRDFHRDLWRMLNQPPPFASRRQWNYFRLECLLVAVAAFVVLVLCLVGLI